MSINILWGCLGGLLGNLIRIVHIANMAPQQRPLIFRDPYWWAQFFILMFLGGVFVLMYEVSSIQLNPVLAVNVGAAAPIIAQNFLSTAPPLGPRRID